MTWSHDPGDRGRDAGGLEAVSQDRTSRAGHAFDNDTGGSFDPVAAKAARGETLARFGNYLS